MSSVFLSYISPPFALCASCLRVDPISLDCRHVWPAVFGFVRRSGCLCPILFRVFASILSSVCIYPSLFLSSLANKLASVQGQVSSHFGFKDECKAKYGLTVYYRFLLSFQVRILPTFYTTVSVVAVLRAVCSLRKGSRCCVLLCGV